MKKIAVATMLFSLAALPAFARHHDSHPKAIHPQNPWLKHPVRHKPHPVVKHHS